MDVIDKIAAVKHRPPQGLSRTHRSRTWSSSPRAACPRNSACVPGSVELRRICRPARRHRASAAQVAAGRCCSRGSRSRAWPCCCCAGSIRSPAPSWWKRACRPGGPASTTTAPTTSWVSLEQISPHAAIAVIASEDQQFPFHAGFDFKSIREAVRASEQRQAPARREHHLAAGGEEPVPVVRPQLRAQGPGGLLHGADRGALAQGAHPRDVPEHRAVRRRHLRRAGRGAALLAQAGAAR